MKWTVGIIAYTQRHLPQHIDEPFYSSEGKEFLFPGWHTDEYLKQCYYNLQEKHDRGGITDQEWQDIERMCFNV